MGQSMNHEMETKEVEMPGEMLDFLLAEMGRLDAEMGRLDAETAHIKGQREKCDAAIKEALQDIAEAVARARERT